MGVVLLGHGVLALGWWLVMPHGFALTHARTLANSLAPAVVFAASAVGLALRARRPARTAAATAGLAGLWLGGLLCALATFPASALRLAPVLLATLAATSLAALLSRPRRALGRPARTRERTAGAALVLGSALGAALAASQRGPDPDTRPLLASIPAPFAGWPEEPGRDRAVPDVRVAAERALVEVDLGLGARLRLEPLLSFESRSPDRCWTLLAPASAQSGPLRVLTERRTSGLIADVDLARGDGPAALRVRARPGMVEVEGLVTLGAPVFGHLCSFAEVQLLGLHAPAIVASPSPGAPIEVRESDYPIGRPLRLACFDGERLRLLEATSGEKGPFALLAEGPLARGEPLALTLLDRGEPVVRLTWLDWTAQAGLQPSPTAGWGLPVNAIELQRDGSVTTLYLTLAATSVGRGWDSVGHAAGVYRDRVVIEPLR